MSSSYVTVARLLELEAVLSDRDMSVLRQVSRLRFVSGEQLARLCFDGDDPGLRLRAARRALLRLVRLDVLARLPRPVGGVRSGSAGFVYRLGVAGQRLAMLRGWTAKRRPRRAHVPGSLFVRHALLVAELHVLLSEAERARRLELLELEGEPACWRSYDSAGFQHLTLKPDSYVRLGAGSYEDSFFIEVDRATEGTRALEGQLARYLDYHATGREQELRGVFPKVLWLTPDKQRSRIIMGCVERLPMQSRELFEAVPFAGAIKRLTSDAGRCRVS